jgi:hypothetical protein
VSNFTARANNVKVKFDKKEKRWIAMIEAKGHGNQ